MSRRRIKNATALMDFYARHREDADSCGCDACLQALAKYRKFNLGGHDARRPAIEAANELAQKHGWR